MFSPPKALKSVASEAVKAEIERRANELIETTLKPKHVEPPPEDARFNYITCISTKWHGSAFYFVATYACPGPNAVSPTFDTNFARLDHVGGGKFNLAFMRHTGKWVELFAGLTLDECLKAVAEDPWFVP